MSIIDKVDQVKIRARSKFPKLGQVATNFPAIQRAQSKVRTTAFSIRNKVRGRMGQ